MQRAGLLSAAPAPRACARLFVESADTVASAGEHERAARRGSIRRNLTDGAQDPWAGVVPRTLEFESQAWGVRGRLDMIDLADDREHHALLAEAAPEEPVRHIVPGRDDRAVVHVTSPGTVLRKDREALVLAGRDGADERVLLKDVGHVAIYGPSQITAQCLQQLLMLWIPVSHHTSAGRLLGISAPLIIRNVALRRAQYRAADDPERCLTIARAPPTSWMHSKPLLIVPSRSHR